MPHNRQQLPAFPGFQKYILQDIRNTLCKISEMHKRVHIAHFQDICKCTGSLNEFSISGGSKWQMSALPKFELNLQICERSTHPHQFEMAWLYLIKYGPAGSSSKLWLPFKMHSWGNFALGSNQFNLLIAFHPQNLSGQIGENAVLIPINVVRHIYYITVSMGIFSSLSSFFVNCNYNNLQGTG